MAPTDAGPNPYNGPMTDQVEIRRGVTTALGAAGFRCKLAPAGIVDDLQADLHTLVDTGVLAATLYDQYGQYWDASPPPEVPEPRTLIVVAWPSPPVKVRFHIDSGSFEAVVPPGYVSSRERSRCLETLRRALGPAGYAVGRARVPDKLLAAHTGLAQYGRNNLVYVPGMGSYVRLDVFCTDADLRIEWQRTKGSLRMSSCPPCRNCHHVCPTGCIPYDGTVIDAERCLTYLNENEGGWPDWLDPRAHNSLVGCMRCQEGCPADRYYLRRERIVEEFEPGETEIILENRPAEQLPGTLLAKLSDLDLETYSTVLGRNLLALMRAGESKGAGLT